MFLRLRNSRQNRNFVSKSEWYYNILKIFHNSRGQFVYAFILIRYAFYERGQTKDIIGTAHFIAVLRFMHLT